MLVLSVPVVYFDFIVEAKVVFLFLHRLDEFHLRCQLTFLYLAAGFLQVLLQKAAAHYFL